MQTAKPRRGDAAVHAARSTAADEAAAADVERVHSAGSTPGRLLQRLRFDFSHSTYVRFPVGVTQQNGGEMAPNCLSATLLPV